MSATFFSPYQLSNLRKIVKLGMIDTATIKRRTVTTDDAGDDHVTWPTVGTCKGWLYHPAPEPVGILDAKSVTVTSTYRLWVDVDVDIRTGDEIVIRGETFRAEDIVHENTFDVFHYASLRKRD